MRAIFTLTLFISSGLLFLVQPMVAKMILPRFGGSPAVWTTSMLFFQVLLLLGYAYAHASTKWLGPKRQAIVHVVLLAIAALLTKLALPATGEVVNNQGQVLLVLALMVGAPFFVLSAGAPLIQRWFGNTSDPAAKDPYFLYSASNLGSMIALVSYPFLIEPRFALGQQASLWTYAFYGLIALMALCAILLQSQKPVADAATTEESRPITNQDRFRWLLLAAVPSSLLLGVTNYMSTNIAPMPLLWIVPLALYLLTFIVAFARKLLVKSAIWARILPLVVTPLALAMILEATEPISVLIGMHLIAFTVAALMCHTRLVETRPSSANLTEFYVWLSVGGAVGGLFNAILAPTVFSTLAEYPIALVAACLLRPSTRPQSLKLDIAFAVGMLVVTACLVLLVKQIGLPPSQARTGIIIGLPAILCFLMVDYPVRYALMLGAVFLGSHLMQTNSQGLVAYTGRSFFGVHRVIYHENGRLHELVHGNTTHGIQDMANPGEPKTYYTRSGPIGEVFEAYPGLPHVAMVGMGVGSCAAYGQPGQRMTYFEIDPVVDKIAKDPTYFTFLRDTKADLDVVLGDARLTLEKQSGPYNLIVLDAFSSDSIPIHLLTKEAMAMYESKLTPEGFISVHISNRYLDLEPILAKVAESLDMTAYVREDAPTDEETKLGKRPSRWMILTRSPSHIAKIIDRSFWTLSEPSSATPLWTDDYSNILSAFNQD